MNEPSVGRPLLDVQDLGATYGSVIALSDVSFSVDKGAVLAVLGVNGAGKSTLARCLAGLVPHRGRISIAGTDISADPPHRRRRHGLVYLPEQRGVFPDLSVMDNLRMSLRLEGSRVERQRRLEEMLEMFPGLTSHAKQAAGTLSGGEQQMLALAGALSMDPQVLVGDELSLGLAPLILDTVFERLEKAKQSGMVVVVIEQYVHRALALADSAIILRRGEIVWSGKSGAAKDEVFRKYLDDSIEFGGVSDGLSNAAKA
jgi:branched-chain amino acid transport system ATP-binding protein